jgi:hypothetical protein
MVIIDSIAKGGNMGITSDVLNWLKKGWVEKVISVLSNSEEPSYSDLDKEKLRKDILAYLPELEKEKDLQDGENIYGDENSRIIWGFFQVLAIIGKNDRDTVQKLVEFIRPEQGLWTRYYALLNLKYVSETEAVIQVKKIVEQEDNDHSLISQLAWVILASMQDKKAVNRVLSDLCESTKAALDTKHKLYNIRWSTLYAICDIPFEYALGSICKILEEPTPYHEYTYQAMFALERFNNNEEAALTLGHFIQKNRYLSNNSVSWYSRQAIQSLSKFNIGERNAGIVPYVLDDICNDSSEIIEIVSKAIESWIGTKLTTHRIVEKASTDPYNIDKYAIALRFMNKDQVSEELYDLSVAGQTAEIMSVASNLLVEIGGLEAYKKLQIRSAAMDKYAQSMKLAENQLQESYNVTIQDAQHGFKLTTWMDMILFYLGIALLASSAILALVNGGDLSNWAGIGVTGGAGVLSVLYSILIAKPRKQVEASADHLMKLKIIFLAYIRQLHEIDQTYIRHMIEDSSITSNDVGEFTKLIDKTMSDAIQQLSVKKDEAK